MMFRPPLEIFDGDLSHWKKYLDQVYQAFLESLVNADIYFRGLKINVRYKPETEEKHYSFWHLVSESSNQKKYNEEDRIPDLARCERIRWIGWVISQAENEGFKWWENKRYGGTNVVIWDEENDFVVILSKRNNYYLLKTAYTKINSHRKDSFEKEYMDFKNIEKS